MPNTKTLVQTITSLMATGIVAATISTAQADSYSITPNIFSGGYDLSDGSGKFGSMTPNVFSGGWDVDLY